MASVTDDKLTVTQIAALYGIKPATFRAYVKRNQAPPADGQHDGRTPYWLRSTLMAWRTTPEPSKAVPATGKSDEGESDHKESNHE